MFHPNPGVFFTMAGATKPANLKWFRVIVVMPLDVSRTAGFAGLARYFAGMERILIRESRFDDESVIFQGPTRAFSDYRLHFPSFLRQIDRNDSRTRQQILPAGTEIRSTIALIRSTFASGAGHAGNNNIHLYVLTC